MAAAVLFARSITRRRPITHFLRTIICPSSSADELLTTAFRRRQQPPCSSCVSNDHHPFPLFSASSYSSYSSRAATAAGGFITRSTAGVSSRRFESALAERRAEPVAFTDEEDDEDDSQQGIEFPGGRVPLTPQMEFISESSDTRVPCFRVLDDHGCPIQQGSLDHHHHHQVQLDKDAALKMYSSMVTLQTMDTIFYEAQRQGRLSFYMTAAGEEAVNIGAAAALTSDDVVLAQYREHGVLLWRGYTLQEFANQCLGTKDDPGKGRQMPVHYGSKELNYFTISSPLTTQVPQAAGVAYSLKIDNKNACAVVFLGDGASSEGDFHAGMNFAAVMDVPLMFICRNNGWAISTPTSEQFRSDGLAVKGRGYGMRSIRVDGNDALAVYTAIRAAREMIIREQKPILVETLTYRVGHHSTSDDSTKYRSLEEIEQWRTNRSPITRFRKWVEGKGWWSEDEETQLRADTRQQVLKALQTADKAEKPALKDMFSDVYDEPPQNLREQEKSLRETVRRHPKDFPTNVSV